MPNGLLDAGTNASSLQRRDKTVGERLQARQGVLLLTERRHDPLSDV
jgi:hypothetical protein